jgi:hypothetical protein
MGAATTLIGCLPAYGRIGLAAPVLLALLRLVQGLAIGSGALWFGGRGSLGGGCWEGCGRAQVARRNPL